MKGTYTDMIKISKNITFYALLALMILTLTPAATLAADLPEALLTESYETDDPGIPDDNDIPMYQIDENYIEATWLTDVYVAFAEWEKFGYPDDIGGVYSTDGENGVAFLVVNPSQQRIKELHDLYSNNLVITPCIYSYNELRQVQHEITELMISNSNSGIYGCGIGWNSRGGLVQGFGESGKEFRVTITVDEGVFDHYNAGFISRYGDRVYVEVGMAMLDMEDGSAMPGGSQTIAAAIVPVEITGHFGGNSAGGFSGSNIWLWTVIGVCLLITLTFFMRLFLRTTPAKQTTTGSIITENSALTSRQVISAVRESGSEPGKELFSAIMQRVEDQES